MIHTAAVGGRPRGALLSHANLIAASAQLLHYWSLTPDDVNFGALPLFHVAGLGMLLAAQYAGGASIIVPKFDAGTALDAIHRQRVTMLAEFPPILTTLLDAAEIRPDELSSLRIATGLDSPETITRFERLCPQARFWSVFGQSETSGFVTMGRFRDRPGAAGQPTFLATVAVLDDADNPVAPGEVGEIAVRGPTVFKGYWRCDADNAFTFRNDWHHTGDQGTFDAEGYLWYKGRSPAKELIKSGGENVYPAEVEREIAAHPAIAEVVVIGVPDAQWGEAIKAVCSCKSGQSGDRTGDHRVRRRTHRALQASEISSRSSTRCRRRRPAPSIAPRSRRRTAERRPHQSGVSRQPAPAPAVMFDGEIIHAVVAAEISGFHVRV